jgi:uncharacterized protein YdhG (YjbR/CyaY superfamily)
MKATQSKPETMDEYLDRLTSEQRAPLQKLRRAIKSAVPRAEECISYQIPAFRLDGRVLVWFHAASKHLSFFPGSSPISSTGPSLRGITRARARFAFRRTSQSRRPS